jgi:hypothetical protein
MSCAAKNGINSAYSGTRTRFEKKLFAGERAPESGTRRLAILSHFEVVAKALPPLPTFD